MERCDPGSKYELYGPAKWRLDATGVTRPQVESGGTCATFSNRRYSDVDAYGAPDPAIPDRTPRHWPGGRSRNRHRICYRYRSGTDRIGAITVLLLLVQPLLLVQQPVLVLGLLRP